MHDQKEVSEFEDWSVHLLSSYGHNAYSTYNTHMDSKRQKPAAVSSSGWGQEGGPHP